MMIMSVAELEELQVNLLRDSLEQELREHEPKEHEIISVKDLSEIIL